MRGLRYDGDAIELRKCFNAACRAEAARQAQLARTHAKEKQNAKEK
jgi:hypothetical protein